MPITLQNGVSSTGDCKSIVSWTPLDNHSPAVGTGGVSPVRPPWIARAPPLRTSKRPRRFHAYEAHSRWAALRIGQPMGDDPKTVPTMMSCVDPFRNQPRVSGEYSGPPLIGESRPQNQPRVSGEYPFNRAACAARMRNQPRVSGEYPSRGARAAPPVRINPA